MLHHLSGSRRIWLVAIAVIILAIALLAAPRVLGGSRLGDAETTTPQTVEQTEGAPHSG